MKLFEMSNSYTQKTRSIWIFYTGIALVLKSWTVLCICFWIWKKHTLYWNFVRPAVEDSSQQQARGFCHRLFQAGLSEWWMVLLNPCLLIFALHRLYLLFRLFVHVYSTACFSFCFYFLFIVLETLWALFIHHLGELVALRSFDPSIWSPWWDFGSFCSSPWSACGLP